jgi:hypothetical protein
MIDFINKTFPTAFAAGKNQALLQSLPFTLNLTTSSSTGSRPERAVDIVAHTFHTAIAKDAEYGAGVDTTSRHDRRFVRAVRNRTSSTVV